MLIEVTYRNGHKERMIVRSAETLLDVVRNAEEIHPSTVKQLRIVKRDHRNQTDRAER